MQLLVLLGLLSTALAVHLHQVPNSKIIGGSDLDIHDVPYQVSIQYVGHICSGVIISDQWVLTVANCVVGISERLATIRYGSTNQNSGGLEMKVDKIIVYSGYDRTTLHHDIALVKVIGRFDIRVYRFPANLPVQDEPLPEGSLARASGWGYQSSANLTIADKLQAVNLQILNAYQDCHRAYTDFGITLSCAYIVCAGDLKNGAKGICGGGDSGAPLLVESQNKLLGVGSFSFDCGHPKYPSVFTMVSKYRNWIMTNSGI